MSEKAAALDVVHNRLAHVGLDEYVLELHSHKTTRAAVATALGASLLRRPKPNPALTSRDLHDAARRRDALSRYARRSTSRWTSSAAASLHHLLGEIAASCSTSPRRRWRSRPTLDAHRGPRARASGCSATWEVVERGDDFVWRGATGCGVERGGRAARARGARDARGPRWPRCARAPRRPPRTSCSTRRAGPRAARGLATLLDALVARPADVPPGWLADVDPHPAARARGRACAGLARGRVDDAAARRRERGGASRASRRPPSASAAPRRGSAWPRPAARLAGAARGRAARAGRATSGSRGRRRRAAAAPRPSSTALHGLRSSDLTLAAAEAAVELAARSRTEPRSARRLAARRAPARRSRRRGRVA